MKKPVVVAGNGKLAASIVNGLPAYLTGAAVCKFENRDDFHDGAGVLVHLGSGRQFDSAMDYCSETGTPMIQCSTDISAGLRETGFTYIDAPNLNILMLKFMYMLRENGPLFRGQKISITESHQQSKKSVPGTAIEFADALGVDPAAIQSIRDPEFQAENLGIPQENLDLHAYHEIEISSEFTSINMKTFVKGHGSYVPGLASIIMAAEKLEKRYHHITELIERKLI